MITPLVRDRSSLREAPLSASGVAGDGSAGADGGGDGGATGPDLAMDATGDGGSTPLDGGSSPDLSCNPGPASPWVADTSPPGAATIPLSGVTGNGAGDLWVVGPPSYAAHRAGTWNTITLSALITSVGRVVYSPTQAQAMAVGGSTAGGDIVYLNKTTAPTPDLVTVAPETVSGIWVSAAPERIPYFVGSAGTVQSFANGLVWMAAGSPAPTPTPRGRSPTPAWDPPTGLPP